MKRNKIPKAMRKYYLKGYNKGFRSGQLRSVEGAVDKFRKAYPNIARQGTELRKEYSATAAQEITPPHPMHIPFRDDSIKWQGFLEAMNAVKSIR